MLGFTAGGSLIFYTFTTYVTTMMGIAFLVALKMREPSKSGLLK